MSTPASVDSPVVVIGAGPHGLGAAAHLRKAGVPAIAFGKTLEFWRQTMPKGMVLRSPLRASNISSPAGELSLEQWAAEHGRELAGNLPIADFIEYGTWFQQQAVPDLDERKVASVDNGGECFTVTLDGGERLTARRVVIAAGLGPFAHVPAVFGELPDSLVTHVASSPALERFAGRAVVVVGSGQSALETAALLAENGARAVEVIARARAVFWLNHGWRPQADEPVLPPPRGPAGPPSWRARNGLYWHGAPTDVGGRFSSWAGAAPDVVRHLPRAARTPLTYRCIRPAGADWLPDRLRNVTITLGRNVTAAEPHAEGVRLHLDDGSERAADHVLLGTGYRVDVLRYPFITPELGARLRVADGSPLLGRGLESSVPGLHFLGAPAAESFGPTMRFVVGTAYTAPSLAQYLSGVRRPLFRWAF